MNTLTKNKPAFTMLEMIFVIVILGIVSSIGAEIIANVYKSYIEERATHRSSIKTELAATQLANRLAYSIPGTVIGKRKSNSTYKAIDNLDANDYDILEWIGYDNDSFAATRVPGWSGFIDLDASSSTSLKTNGSVLRRTKNIIKYLSYSEKSLKDSALFFPREYNVNNIGYSGDNSGVVLITQDSNKDTINVNASGKTIKEHYKLAWSAYALVTEDNGDGTYNLVLYYNYRPWMGDTYLDGKSSILLRNISVFKFVGSQNTIRFKICQQEKMTQDSKITICKEKAVIR